MTLGAKAADASLGTIVARSLGKAREQIDRTAALIQNRHVAFAHIPADRPVIGLIVSAEPFYLSNAGILPEYGAHGTTPAQVISLRELEHFVCLDELEAIDLLQSVLADPEKRTWSLASVMKELRSVGKNPILEQAGVVTTTSTKRASKQFVERRRGAVVSGRRQRAVRTGLGLYLPS
jgi:hypothetical protein